MIFQSDSLFIVDVFTLIYYLGGNDIHQEDTWVWQTVNTSQTMKFFARFPGQPNNLNGNENCLTFQKKGGMMEWYDLLCGHSLSFICEWRSD